MGANQENSVFLTYEEAVEAIRLDLSRYPPQPILLRRLAQIILGDDWVFSEDAKRSGVWIKFEKAAKPRLISYDQLPERLCSAFDKTKISHEALAEICRSVFQEKALVGTRESDGVTGVYVETGADHFKCRQCGQCCRELEYHKELTDEDYQLWKKLGRKDILERVGVIRINREITAYRIWVDPVTKRIIKPCPWLKKDSEHNRYLCLIHDVRPQICRQYPGSRKHARMTGCPGLDD